MLIQFTLGNFLSFNEKMSLDLRAKGISELKGNVITVTKKEKFLRSAVIYGANSSGKSNLIKGFERMRDLVLNSVRLNDKDELTYSPFLLSTDSLNLPSYFEVVFMVADSQFRFGFEYNRTKIVSEWLFKGMDKSEKALFIRTEEGIGVSDKFEEGKGLEAKTNDNRLFISLVAQLGGKLSKSLLEFFKNYNVLSGLDHNDYIGFTTRMYFNDLYGAKQSLTLFKNLKLGFNDIKAVMAERPALAGNFSDELKNNLIRSLANVNNLQLKTAHNRYDKDGNIAEVVFMDKIESESQGTNKIIDLAGPIFDSLKFGKLLIIDELDAKLHPLITIHIVDLFNNPDTNPNGAQVIFAAHDTNLLGEDIFRRDQIWFTEMNQYEQTELYSLYDFNLADGTKVRNDANLERNYIRGRYGAIPFITN